MFGDSDTPSTAQHRNVKWFEVHEESSLKLRAHMPAYYSRRPANKPLQIARMCVMIPPIAYRSSESCNVFARAWTKANCMEMMEMDSLKWALRNCLYVTRTFACSHLGWEWNLRANFRDYAHDDNVQWPNNRRKKKRVWGAAESLRPCEDEKERMKTCVWVERQKKNVNAPSSSEEGGEKITRIIYFLFSSHFYSFAFTLFLSFFGHCVLKAQRDFLRLWLARARFPSLFFAAFCCMCSPFTTDEWESWNECCETPKSLHDYSPFSLCFLPTIYLLPRFSSFACMNFSLFLISRVHKCQTIKVR